MAFMPAGSSIITASFCLCWGLPFFSSFAAGFISPAGPVIVPLSCLAAGLFLLPPIVSATTVLPFNIHIQKRAVQKSGYFAPLFDSDHDGGTVPAWVTVEGSSELIANGKVVARTESYFLLEPDRNLVLHQD